MLLVFYSLKQFSLYSEQFISQTNEFFSRLQKLDLFPFYIHRSWNLVFALIIPFIISSTECFPRESRSYTCTDFPRSRADNLDKRRILAKLYLLYIREYGDNFFVLFNFVESLLCFERSHYLLYRRGVYKNVAETFIEL